ncbi:ABC transporter ATP-binding protein [Enterococcus cecorum]|uniref:ABC transporter ATP-binding protein n=1 Tax=Enterococcus cecorum DSM 20682 = ATCC 43198 TaxID=1121864 RepID=S1R2Y0_9ENTE|nr:ABC transporter ATP-binding protein [Enterococcus cecorum]EOX17184.1 ABC transporter ATP-binding protein [Enterococcus cecorum DSM 20682 = ATCC 43198]ESK61830.1 ABC transporter ATP-binding protein [Enterococcus cecorum DSM 20682 = ATCC 43198]OJG33185.1 ABC transporter ATP-binding protein [Enterococcus cecorum DSM 20682 = ATCC 43198]CAI3301833.1 ABC transporter ATP-binding protein [Enterococcus cecorum DSM 20682 = ATCC 43198]SQE55619.1 ABC-type polysaccharide/polyol phosphate transport syste
MSEYAIELKHITKTYAMYAKPTDRLKEALDFRRRSYHDIFYALNDVNIHIKKGEMIGFIGENGSGKSTLLKIITGVLTPTSGEMQINGNIAALLELGSGFNPEYSGYDNIYLNGMVLGFTKEQVDGMVDDIISFADIGDHLYQPVKTYSSGMFVRLAFAVAINVDPEILIVDEALAVGDLEFQLKCMEKFTEFRNAGKTILFVSHDVNAVRRFCDRVYWLKNGVVENEGETMEVTEEYENFLKRKSLKTVDREKSVVEEHSAPEIVTVDSATLLDGNLEPVDIVEQNSTVYVKVEYTVKDESPKNPVLGVAIRTVQNHYVCGLNTLLDKTVIPWKKGKNVFYIKYPNMSLLSGEYYFDVAFFEENATVPFVYKTKYVTMFITGKYVGEGIVVLDHEWKESI